jgi:1-aminocyclopropane-1-carboxylate deaminase
MNLDKFERYPLTFGPSPIHPLRRLSQYLDGPEIWAKRDDCNSGLAFGGNKVRKLEYLVPEALAQRCDTLVSIGGVQSNHTRQVAAVAAHLGLKAHLVQEHWVDWPDVVYDRVGNIQLSRILGARVELNPARFSIGIRESWQQALESVRRRGGTPYAIPAGASDHPLGGLGFANFAREVERQERDLDIFFDHVIVCSVTGSTQAGMIVGFASQGRPRQVIGIDASAKPEETRAQILKIARHTADIVDLHRDIVDDDVVLEERYAGERYGIPTPATLEAIRLTARLEGMLTDPVYEGKSMAGLIDLAARGRIPRDAKMLYVHLGGAPALSAYGALFSSEPPATMM